MGLLDDVGNALAYTSPATYFLKEGLSRSGRPVNVIPGVDQTRSDEKIASDTTARSKNNYQALVDKIYGNNPQEYSPVFGQGYQNLGQQAGGHDSIVSGGTQTLAESFVNRVLKKTGKLPSEEQVRQFVSENLTPGFAQKYITGLPTDQITYGIVDPYLEDHLDITTSTPTTPVIPQAQNDIQNRVLGLSDQLKKFYSTAREHLGQNVEDSYGASKRSVVNDLAAQNLLTQPTSRYVLNDLEANKNRSLDQGLTQLSGEEASGNLDLSKTIEGLLANERRAGESSDQFAKNFGLAKQNASLQRQAFNAGRDDTAFSQGLQRQQLSMADQLGRLQARAQEPGWADYLKLGLQGAGTAASVATAFK